MPIPLIAAAGLIAKIAQSVYTWSTKTPQGQATMAAATAVAAYQQNKTNPHSKWTETATEEATKRVGEHIVRPAADSLYKHIRNDLNKP